MTMTEEELRKLCISNYKLATKVCNELQKHEERMNKNFDTFCHYFKHDHDKVQELFISCQDNGPCVYFKETDYHELEIRFHCVTNWAYSDFGKYCDKCKGNYNFIFNSSCIPKNKRWCIDCLSEVHNCGKKIEFEKHIFLKEFWPYFQPYIFESKNIESIQSLQKFEKKLENDIKYFLKLRKEKKNLGFNNSTYSIFKAYTCDETTLLLYIFELKNIQFIFFF
jgi:hypothetical protein